MFERLNIDDLKMTKKEIMESVNNEHCVAHYEEDGDCYVFGLINVNDGHIYLLESGKIEEIE